MEIKILGPSFPLSVSRFKALKLHYLYSTFLAPSRNSGK